MNLIEAIAVLISAADEKAQHLEELVGDGADDVQDELAEINEACRLAKQQLNV